MCFKVGKLEFKRAMVKASLVRAEVKKIFNLKEVKELGNCGKKYKTLFRLKISKEQRAIRLLDILMQISSYTERLTSIKNDLALQNKNILRILNSLRRTLSVKTGFVDLKKNEKVTVLSAELYDFEEIVDDIKFKLEMVENTMDYLNSLQFNLKTGISYLKVQDYRRE